ncbi:ADAM family of metalloprotease-like protein ADM-B [Zalerion maritima]|uniref:Disintegrin and metalloproteinase domain-containing protein B n=1 Tax=Zalerion maritima TaxID=339359 RepID=A0AAD5WP64_9PEZI|nr:ADAM family of metalloprotease-like protein ADM-B [Zalerion maritima]
MFNLRSIAIAVIAVGVAVQETLALSQQRNPLSRVTRIDDPILHAPSHRVHSYSDFEITFSLNDKQQKVRLALKPNHDVLADNAQINVLDSAGNVKSIEFVERTDHKVYKGNAFVQQEGSTEWANAGWARISILDDGAMPMFQGAFRIEHDTHHIQTSTSYLQTKHWGDPEIEASAEAFMIVWRDSDIIRDDVGGELKRGLSGRSSCVSDHLEFNNDPEHPVYEGITNPPDLGIAEETTPWWAMTAASIFRRQDDGTLGGNGNVDSLSSTIGSTEGCPTTRKVALVGIATDCTYFQDFGSKSDVTQNVIDIVNTASGLYEDTFNISLGIQNLTVIEDECPSTPSDAAPWNVDCSSADITKRLNLFSGWRGQFLDTNAYWTLMSKCNTDSAVGLAWLGQLCSNGSASSTTNETIAGANVVVRTEGGGSEWQVFAHESGHTFGAVHDCTSSTCASGDDEVQKCCPLSSGTCDADGEYIMNPSTGNDITSFSPCSIGNICTAILRQSVKSGCLTSNKDVATISGQQCGNGIVETGEDCDCGGESGCADNPCCNPDTCKFTDGSVCDPSNEDCCTSSCQLASADTVCRDSTGTCDPSETCDGSSAMCPSDEITDDGTDCGDGLQCASGQCTSRDLQCRSVIGVSLTSNDTYACDGSCRMTCHSDSRLPDEYDCYSFMQYFLDGTPCSGGGACENGVCKGSNVVKEIGSWLDENKNIVIPVASVAGGLVLIALLSCCIGSWRRSRRAKHAPKPAVPPMQGQNSWSSYGGAWRGPTAPRSSQARNVSRSGSGGLGSGRSGRSRSHGHIDPQNDFETRQPMLPTGGQPPPYTPGPYAAGRPWQPSRQQSVRYA